MNLVISHALMGGLLIGLASAIVLAVFGQICGISGIIYCLVDRKYRYSSWKLFFIIGLLCGGALSYTYTIEPFGSAQHLSLASMAVAGFLVGLGTRLANGCTSGHGVCGISRLSKRSIVATLVFMTSGMITVYIMKHVLQIG